MQKFKIVLYLIIFSFITTLNIFSKKSDTDTSNEKAQITFKSGINHIRKAK